MSRSLVAVAAALCLAASGAGAQAAFVPPPTLDSTLVRAFAGRWHCAGAFANGRPIASDVAFTPELDGRALLLRHDDRAPQRWRALGLWLADTARTVHATLYDNAGPPRAFVAAPWDGHTLALVSLPRGGVPASRALHLRRPGARLDRLRLRGLGRRRDVAARRPARVRPLIDPPVAE